MVYLLTVKLTGIKLLFETHQKHKMLSKTRINLRKVNKIIRKNQRAIEHSTLELLSKFQFPSAKDDPALEPKGEGILSSVRESSRGGGA